ncbi:hypothetical protein JST97_36895 [bacterium]|nr:hypothetical protein [bacterium]
MTGRQLEVLSYYRRYLTAHHCAPVLREVCQYFGISSTHGALRHLQALVRKGMLMPVTGTGGRVRGYTLTEAGRLATDPLTMGDLPPVTSRQNRCLLRRLAQAVE